MKVKIKDTCPQEVKEKLLQWQKEGWLTVDLSSNVEKKVEVLKPQLNITKIESSPKPIEALWVDCLKSIAIRISKVLDNQEV